jgi:Type IV secretion-system coupling protein DNA-binding domain
MTKARPYVRAVVLVSTPALVLGMALHMHAVTALAIGLLSVASVSYPRSMRVATAESIGSLGKLILILFPALVALAGLRIFIFGAMHATLWAMGLGSVASVLGFTLTKVAVVKFLLTKPPPPPPVRSEVPRPQPLPVVVKPAPLPVPVVATPKALPPPKRMPRELVLWGGRLFPAYETDEHFYVLSGPPGSRKTTLKRLFLRPILEEVLDPDCESLLITFDPQREDWAWITSIWPKTRIPFHLFCSSDLNTVTLDWDNDYRSLTDYEAFSHAIFRKNPFEVQEFFGNAARTLVEHTIAAIKAKLGTWDLRLLVLVLSNPGYVKELLDAEVRSRFAAELLSAKSGETAQNVQMEMASKISKWRKIAAQLSRVPKRNKLSLEKFLREPGVLVIQTHDRYKEQQTDLVAMLLQRIGQILTGFQQDPERKRKIYIVLDEFPALGAIPDIRNFFLRLRSRGVVFLITYQTWASMKRIYKEEAYEILNTCRNFIILGSGDPVDAKHAAELIGKARGWEAQRNESEADGTNESTADGTSDTKGTNSSETRRAGQSGKPVNKWFTARPPDGFVATDTTGKSEAHTTSNTFTRGKTHTTTKGVTWTYFDRDIWSPTEIMRTPLPTRENGVHGIAYRAGEPDACDFVYDVDYIDANVHQKHHSIKEYDERPDHHDVIDELTSLELRDLGLTNTNPSAPELYPTQEEFVEQAGVDWDKEAEEESQEGEQESEDENVEDDDDGDQWLIDFANL